MLAKITAGGTFGPKRLGGGKRDHVNEVMAAMGMGRAGAWGSAILLANYSDDPSAMELAVEMANRWAWLTWLKVGRKSQAVTAGQMKALAGLAVSLHCNPALGRATTVKGMAAHIGVNHHTFRVKYRKHFHRIMAEIQYREQEAITALKRHL